MPNQFPGRLGLKPTINFELVHNTKPDSKIWFEILSIGYFNHMVDNIEICSKLQSHTLDGIAVGMDDKSNVIIFYNPLTSSYCCPPAFHLDESLLPITNFTNPFRFDGGLTCGLLQNKTDPIQEPLTQGTCVSIQHKNSPVRSTTNKILLPVSPIIEYSASTPSNTSDRSSQ